MSPFVAVNFPMVTDFTVEVMHTMYIGAFRRRLEGFTSGTSEGKLSTNQIKRINQRLLRFRTCRLYEFDRYVRQITNCAKYKAHELRQFLYYQLYPVFRGIISSDDLSHLLLLQHSMLLLGGFQLSPVPQNNIEKATSQSVFIFS